MKETLCKISIAFILITFLVGCAAPQSTVPPILTAAVAATAPATPDYWPTQGWRSATPEEQGMDSEKLAQMVERIQAEKLDLHSLLVVRNGYLVTELYAHPFTASQPHQVMSDTKSVISTLVGIAIAQGKIKDVHQPLLSLLPGQDAANLNERKKAMTLEHVLTLTTGLKCNENPASGEPFMQASQNWVKFMLDLPMASDPGSNFYYCTGAVQLLSAVLQQATGMSAREYANQVLFGPLGIGPIPESRWPSDPQGVTIGGYGLALTPAEMAKFGYLFLNHGKWENQQIVPAEWVTAATTRYTQSDDGKGYGYLWWIDPQGKYYAALGRSGQHIFVYPTENLVVTFTAGLPYQKNADLIPLQALLDEYILPAIRSNQALPANANSLARLKAGIQALAEPRQAVQPLPALAAQVSGKTYQLSENPNGFQSIVLTVTEGANQATVLINGSLELQVGLDGLYRTVSHDSPAFVEGLRGHWQGQDTLVIEEIVLDQLGHMLVTMQFSGNTVHMTQVDQLTGQTIEMQGVQQ